MGDDRLVDMAVCAIKQLSSPLNVELLSSIPWLLCTPEVTRVGRPDDDRALLTRISMVWLTLKKGGYCSLKTIPTDLSRVKPL